MVTIVIPTLNEGRYLPPLLGDLAELQVPADVVVADGGSLDDTVAVARRAGVQIVTASQGRASQMNAGAAATAGEWLCFLHADVRVPLPARAALEEAVTDPRLEAAVWRLVIDAAGWWYRAVELGARVRDRVGGLPYGDQGLLVRRRLFDAIGGFPEIPVLEDVVLVRAVRRRVRIHRFAAPLVVSARRWRREGPYLSWLRNAALVAAYLAGVAPERLARWYRPEPR